MLQSLKGQAAIEYMTVFGIALVLSAPFVLKAQSSIIDLRSDSNTVSVQNTLNNIEVAADTVSASGEPAARTFSIRLPESVRNTWVMERAIVIQVDTAQGYSNFSRTFDYNISGDLPSESGRYIVKTQANQSKVDIGVVS